MIRPFINQAVEFTKTYQAYKDAPIAVREAMCLKAQYPALLEAIRPEDQLAGRRAAVRIAYMGPIWWYGFPGYTPEHRSEGKQGGYCFDFAAFYQLAQSDEERAVLSELGDFWRQECTLVKADRYWDPEKMRYAGGSSPISSPSVGFTVALDLDRLVRRGLPGLQQDVQARKERAQAAGEGTDFLDGLGIALQVVEDVSELYHRQALELAQQAQDANDRQRLLDIAQALKGITQHVPQTFREAAQLVWVYLLLACGKHPETWRLDIALGDLYAQDIDSGVLDEETGVQIIQSLWRLINETGDVTVCRLILGGKGRRNEPDADRFTMAALEATRRHKRVTPQVSLRFYEGQNPALMHKAFDAIAESYTFPTLYNDDVIVPGIKELFGVSEQEAMRYHPLGCGEYMLGGCSPSLLDVSWNVPKVVEAALHNGASADGKIIGPRTGALETLDSFEKLYEAVAAQIRFAADVAASIYRAIVNTMADECAFLLASLLTDDCLERAQPMFAGGVRYMGACAMGHGFTNAADSLIAIKKLVYDEGKLTLPELVAALDEDFAGQELLRRALLQAPKFGNDVDEVDNLLADLYRVINRASTEAGKRVGLAFFTVSSVNPGGYYMGQGTGATADGRRKGEPFAIGNSPTAGCDVSGLTALFNSVAKIDPANGGAITNFKISRQFFTDEREKLEAMFDAYFTGGGMQANVTVINKEDLEAALVEPEKYPHVLVRLGGWTARFIDLEPYIQKEILKRTLY